MMNMGIIQNEVSYSLPESYTANTVFGSKC